jgi:hypothetical protein
MLSGDAGDHIPPSHMDIVSTLVARALNDAAVGVRDVGKRSYAAMCEVFPAHTRIVLARVGTAMRAQLVKLSGDSETSASVAPQSSLRDFKRAQMQRQQYQSAQNKDIFDSPVLVPNANTHRFARDQGDPDDMSKKQEEESLRQFTESNKGPKPSMQLLSSRKKLEESFKNLLAGNRKSVYGSDNDLDSSSDMSSSDILFPADRIRTERKRAEKAALRNRTQNQNNTASQTASSSIGETVSTSVTDTHANTTNMSYDSGSGPMPNKHDPNDDGNTRRDENRMADTDTDVENTQNRHTPSHSATQSSHNTQHDVQHSVQHVDIPDTKGSHAAHSQCTPPDAGSNPRAGNAGMNQRTDQCDRLVTPRLNSDNTGEIQAKPRDMHENSRDCDTMSTQGTVLVVKNEEFYNDNDDVQTSAMSLHIETSPSKPFPEVAGPPQRRRRVLRHRHEGAQTTRTFVAQEPHRNHSLGAGTASKSVGMMPTDLLKLNETAYQSFLGVNYGEQWPSHPPLVFPASFGEVSRENNETLDGVSQANVGLLLAECDRCVLTFACVKYVRVLVRIRRHTLCMCVCVCVCSSLLVQSICAYMYACMYVSVDIHCVCVCVLCVYKAFTYTCTRACTYSWTYIVCVCVFLFACIKPLRIHVRMHMCTRRLYVMCVSVSVRVCFGCININAHTLQVPFYTQAATCPHLQMLMYVYNIHKGFFFINIHKFVHTHTYANTLYNSYVSTQSLAGWTS